MIGTLRPLPPANTPGPGMPPPGGGAKTLATADLEVKIAPRLEWAQMSREVWRMQREMFYDPALHGVNLQDAMAKYGRYLPNLSSRSDLTYAEPHTRPDQVATRLSAVRSGVFS